MTRRSFFALLSAPLLAGLAACKSPFPASAKGPAAVFKTKFFKIPPGPPEFLRVVCKTVVDGDPDGPALDIEFEGFDSKLTAPRDWTPPDDFYQHQQWLLNQLPGGP